VGRYQGELYAGRIFQSRRASLFRRWRDRAASAMLQRTLPRGGKGSVLGYAHARHIRDGACIPDATPYGANGADLNYATCECGGAGSWCSAAGLNLTALLVPYPRQMPSALSQH